MRVIGLTTSKPKFFNLLIIMWSVLLNKIRRKVKINKNDKKKLL